MWRRMRPSVSFAVLEEAGKLFFPQPAFARWRVEDVWAHRVWSECVRFRAELRGPLVVGFHEWAGHASFPLRHQRLLLGFVATCLLAQPIERVLDDVSAADAKRVEELGFDVTWDATHRERQER